MSQDSNPNPSRPTFSTLLIFMYWACERQGSKFLVFLSKSSNGKCAKLHTVTASNNRNQPTRSLLLLLVRATYIFLWRLHLAPPSHPGQRPTLLWLERPKSKRGKLHTVAAINNRETTSCLFSFCLFVPHIYKWCSSHTFHLWWIAHWI